VEILTSEVLADKFVFLEGLRWHDGQLDTSDLWDHTVYAVSEAGEREVIVKVPNRPSGLGWLPDDSMIIVSVADRKLMRLSGDRLVTHADLVRLAGGELNDRVVDAQGRAYCCY
jgi:sugar lactone lactonase YvrE